MAKIFNFVYVLYSVLRPLDHALVHIWPVKTRRWRDYRKANYGLFEFVLFLSMFAVDDTAFSCLGDQKLSIRL